MCWDEFMKMAAFGTPGLPSDVLFIHLGGNDLAKWSGKSIVLDILRDLRAWKAMYPSTRIV